MASSMLPELGAGDHFHEGLAVTLGVYSIDDVCGALTDIGEKTEEAATSVQEISSNGVYTIKDVCASLNSVELSIDNFVT